MMRNRTAPFPLLVLDLDGTLVDSLPDLSAALNRLMAARHLAEFAPSEVAAMVGDGTQRLVARAFAARGQISAEADLDAFLADYASHADVETRPFPGIAETLGALRASGWRFAVCTNKQEATAKALLDAVGLAYWFAAVGGGDSFPGRKPDPVHLRDTIAAAGGSLDRAVMTGDHANDITVARAVGIPSIFAAWGYGAPHMAEGASACARRFTELAALAPRLLA